MSNSFHDLIQTVHALRAPGGCPWDQAQTHQSLRPYLIEEAYEVLDVIDDIYSSDDLKNEATRSDFREELGDLLMQVMLHAEMADQVGAFNIHDVAQGLNDKLIRRHPHVFADQKVDGADQAIQTWEKQKAKERADNPDASVLDGLPNNLPALQKAARTIEKVTKIGFQWDDLKGPVSKIDEELAELKQEIPEHFNTPLSEAQKNRIESEIGDLFFTLCNLAYLLKISPEDALRKMLDKFQARFRHVERSLASCGKTPDQSNLKEMDSLWNEAKTFERKVSIWGLTGGIASGKSTVAGIFAKKGFPVLDADQVARDLRGPGGKATPKIEARFGTSDPKKLRDIVFKDPEAKKDLEKIIHPLIRLESFALMKKMALDQLAKNPDQDVHIIYEASLLIETKRYKEFDGLIVVHAPSDTRKTRLITRDQSSDEQADQIISSQLTEEERMKHASHVIQNTGDVKDLEKQVDACITALFKSGESV